MVNWKKTLKLSFPDNNLMIRNTLSYVLRSILFFFPKQKILNP